MNIVFWLGIALAGALLWYGLLPLFKYIGRAAKNVAEDITEEMTEEDENE